MADTKITALSALTGANVATGDELALVDVSDTSMAASGTDKNITANELRIAMATTLGVVGIDKIWDAAGDFVVGTGADTGARVAATAAGHTLMFDGTNGVAKVIRAQYDAGAVVSNTATLTTLLAATMTAKAPFTVGDAFRFTTFIRYLNNTGGNLTPTLDFRLAGTSLGVLSWGAIPTATNARNMWLDFIFTITAVSATGTVSVGAYANNSAASVGGAWVATTGSGLGHGTAGSSLTIDTTADITVDLLGAPQVGANANYTPGLFLLTRLPKL